jgi:hypothetical protein
MENQNISMNEFNDQYNKIMNKLSSSLGHTHPYAMSGSTVHPYAMSGGTVHPYAMSGGTVHPYAMSGGARSEDSDSDSTVTVGDASRIVKVNCINVLQKKNDLKFEGRICKTPAITLKFKQENVKLANVVKSLLHFVNKRLRMADVDSVEIVKGKKKTTHDGKDLSKDVNMNDLDDVSEVNIVMH